MESYLWVLLIDVNVATAWNRK